MDIDVDRLVKLLNLSSSDSDGEALNAVRKANEMLNAKRVRWDSVLFPNSRSFYCGHERIIDSLKIKLRAAEHRETDATQIITRLRSQLEASRMELEALRNRAQPPPPNEPPPPEPTIQEMLDVCLKEVDSQSGQEFIHSLNAFYGERKFLTPKQLDALKKFYWNCC